MSRLAIPDEDVDRYILKAHDHLQATRRSWSEKDHDTVMYVTAVYLYQLDQLCTTRPAYPYYVVHSQDKDWRFETPTTRLAFNTFKKACADGERVAMFYWENKGTCIRTHASEGYAFERDFGASV